MEDVLLLHSMDPSAMALSQDSIATTAAEALCCSMTQACSSDTSSGPVPTLDGVTIVPVANLSSASLAAAAAAAEKQQQARSCAMSPTQEATLETLRSRRRLLFTQAPPECTEDAIKAWCSRYGAVEQVQLYSDPSHNAGTGSGLITMASNEAAAAALAALQGSSPAPPAPLGKLCVTWLLLLLPDDHGTCTSSDSLSAAPALVASADRTVFFAKVPPTALASEVELLFGSFGKLAEVNLFKAWAGAKHSKGCGLITYADRNDARAAIGQLHGKYVFPGSDCPMVVEWIDLKKQRPMSVAPAVEKPPIGAAPDSYKVLLSNVPSSATEDTLFAALGQFGRLVQLVLAPDVAGPCASGYLWYSSKGAADALLNRSKAEPVWVRDTRSGYDLALSVKKVRRPGLQGANGAAGSTTSRVNVGFSTGGFHSGPLLGSGGSTSSSNSYLPIMHLASLQAAVAAAHSQELPGSNARLAAAAAAAGSYSSNSASLDALGMLANSNMIRLLPLQHQQQQQQQMAPAVAGLLGGPGSVPYNAMTGLSNNGYSVHDVCEAMLEYCDTSGLNMGMPVHLQPSIASQMASNLNRSLPCLVPVPQQQQQQQQQRQINGQLCLQPTMIHTSGQHCLSSPANIQGMEEFEGSFAMPTLRSGSNSGTLMSGGNLSSGLQHTAASPQQMLWQQQQQQAAVQQAQLQQQQQQQAQLQAQVAAQQQQQQQAVGGMQSMAVPINSWEVQNVAENLNLCATNSGARASITSLPGTGLAVIFSGQPEQVALAQSLLAAARRSG